MLADLKRAREKAWKDDQESKNATELDVTKDMVGGEDVRAITQPSNFTLKM